MVSALLRLFYREISGLHQAAYLLGVFALLSQLFALLRDRLLAGSFGAGIELDLYYAAFRIPDFIFISVASLVSLSVLIPFLVDRIETGFEAEKKFIDTIFSFFFIIIVLSAGVAWFLTPFVVPHLFPGFTSDELQVLVFLSRVLLISPIMLGFSNLLASITQVYKRFFIYALSPVLYNLGIIVGILFFAPSQGIIGVVWGVVLGAVLHLAIQVPFIASRKLIPHFTTAIDWSVVKAVFSLSLPRTLTLSMNHIVIIFLLSIASLMASGSIAIFNFSYNLQSVPLSIIGVSYSLAAFPVLSSLYRKGEFDEFIAKIQVAARHIIFWSIPVMVLFIVLRAQVVRVILGSGEFTWSDTRLTAASLALFALSIVFQGLSVLFVRGFYATGNTKTPLAINLLSGVVAIASAYGLFHVFQNNEALLHSITTWLRVETNDAALVLALPLAFTIGSILNGLFLWVMFGRRFATLSDRLTKSFRESCIASIGIGLASYVLLNMLDTVLDLNTLHGIFLQGFIAGVGGIMVGALLFVLLGNEEVQEVWSALRDKFWKAKVVGPDPDVVA